MQMKNVVVDADFVPINKFTLSDIRDRTAIKKGSSVEIKYPIRFLILCYLVLKHSNIKFYTF
jgi:hypothetical protein